jgi:hypothetical protein
MFVELKCELWRGNWAILESLGLGCVCVYICMSLRANDCYYSYILGEPNTSQSVIYYTDRL